MPLNQRQHTLLSTMEAIMEYQNDFFLTGDDTEMRPMILKDIAEKTQTLILVPLAVWPTVSLCRQNLERTG